MAVSSRSAYSSTKKWVGSWSLSKIDKAALLELDLDLLRDGVSVATRNNATMHYCHTA